MKATKITVKSVIKAEKAKVWDYYTNPKHIVNWNFASDDWCCPHAENDMKVGGKYLARMEAKDGSFGFDFEAVYLAIDPGKSFSYEMSDGRVVDVSLSAGEGNTSINVTFDAETQNSIDMQREGWQAILDNFRRYTEGN